MCKATQPWIYLGRIWICLRFYVLLHYWSISYIISINFYSVCLKAWICIFSWVAFQSFHSRKKKIRRKWMFSQDCQNRNIPTNLWTILYAQMVFRFGNKSCCWFQFDLFWRKKSHFMWLYILHLATQKTF